MAEISVVSVKLDNRSSESPREPTAAIPCGTDRALAAHGASGRFHEFSYWDLWFALVAEQDFGGDLEALAQHFRGGLKGGSLNQHKAREKLSHLRDLQHRLLEANLGSRALIDLAPQLAHLERKRARGRVLRHNERQFERSEPMRHLPLERRWQQALRGRWSRFPVSPAPVADRISRLFSRSRGYSEKESWEIAEKLDLFLIEADGLVQRKAFAEAQATLRGFITAVLELIECADDSFGVIGQTFDGAFRTYLRLPLEKTGIAENVFFEDLLDLMILEDYGFTDNAREGYFASLSRPQGDFCMTYARRQIIELKAWDLDSRSEEALTLLGQIAAEQGRFDEFEALAREMEARHWERIMRLTDAAMKGRKRPLAEKVFEAALASQQGWHVEFLQNRYQELKRGEWRSDWKRTG